MRSEAGLVADCLARRLTATRKYGDGPILVVEEGDLFFLKLPLLDADVLVLVDPAGARVRAVLSYLIPKRQGGIPLHLNGWIKKASDEGASPDDLASRAWEKFYQDELENHDMSRILWMHGPILPVVPVPPEPSVEDAVEALVAEVTSSPQKPARKPLVDASVFDLFEE